jgi:hypothetical protein
MSTPTDPDQSGLTVQQTPPRFKALQWTNQGDPNDAAIFPPAKAMAMGVPVVWSVDSEGTLSADNWGTYRVGSWFISGSYFGEFPGWSVTGAQPLPGDIVGPGLPYSEVSDG